MENDIKVQLALGQNMRDLTSGFTGVAIQKVEQFNGNVRYALQPMSEDPSKYPDAIEVDQHILETLGPGLSANVVAPVDNSGVALGNHVEDIASGFKGYAMNRAIHMNGCVSYGIVPQHTEKGALPNTAPSDCWFSSTRVKKLGDGLVLKAKPAARTAKEAPGGLSTKAVRL